MLKYLARYVAGAAISDARLLAHNPAGDGSAMFRATNCRQGRKREQLTLTGLEFTRRVALHILPRGFQRVRSYGLLSQRGGEHRLPLCRALLKSSGPWAADFVPATPSAGVAAEPAAERGAEPPRCPNCDQPAWFPGERAPRPSLWDVLLRSGFAPAAFRQDSS